MSMKQVEAAEEEEEAVLNFCDLIQTLVQDTEERREFFSVTLTTFVSLCFTSVFFN